MQNLNRTLQRGLAILELLSEHPQGLELHGIADALTLPKSTAHNLVQTLLQLHYVTCSDGGRYALSTKTFEVGAAAVQATDVSALLREHMLRTVAECNETMHCGVRSGLDVLYIDKVESTQSVRMSSHVGIRQPLYATAMGKAFLAAMSDEDIRALYPGPLPRLTPATIPTVDALLQQIRQIRAEGYSVEDQENTEGVCCVAVTLCGRDGTPLYALSLSVPAFRMDAEKRETCVRLLKRAKRRVERMLRVM